MIRILGQLEPRILATPNFYGTTPCFVAAEYGHVEILRLLGVSLITNKLTATRLPMAALWAPFVLFSSLDSTMHSPPSLYHGNIYYS